MKRKCKASYSISVVAEMFGVHQQTIRLYEKEGLIRPSRSDGNTRRFTEEDVEQLEEVIRLTHELGVNLSGVNIILKLQKKIKRLQSQVNKLFEQTSDQLEKDSDIFKEDAKTRAAQLIEIKRGKAISASQDVSSNQGSDDDEVEVSFEEWDIDYNEQD